MPAAFNALLLSLAMGSVEGQYVSPNFVVQAPTTEIARQVAEAAEASRRKLAVQWYGHEINNWGERCRVSVVVGKKLGAGGATRFKFDRGEVYGWNMEVQGSLERILDSVIPHEVNHTILACYFRRKVPRWADEGAATVVEHISEKSRSFELAEKLINQGRRIPLRILLNMTQYPENTDQVLAMYAQGYSLTEFLLQRRGRKHFLNFLNDAHHRGWDRAISTFYGSQGIEQLEQKWSSWVLAGSPRLDLPNGQLLASVGHAGTSERATGVVRSQGPEARVPPYETAADSNGLTVARPAAKTRTAAKTRPVAKTGAAALFSRVGQFTRNLTAPDPRARPATLAPAAFQATSATGASPDFSVTASRAIAPRATVPRALPRENSVSTPLAVSRRTRSEQPLQPLALTRIEERATPRVDASSTPLPGRIQTRFAGEATGIDRHSWRLQETRLRTATPKRAQPTAKKVDRFLNWSQFPTRVRSSADTQR